MKKFYLLLIMLLCVPSFARAATVKDIENDFLYTAQVNNKKELRLKNLKFKKLNELKLKLRLKENVLRMR